MMAASTRRAPPDSTMSSIVLMVSTFTALQSMMIGFLALRLIAIASCSASATASPGGTIDRMMSALAISPSLAPTMPAAAALFRVASLRPSSEVNTLQPCSIRRAAMALPMAPGAITAMRGGMMTGSDSNDSLEDYAHLIIKQKARKRRAALPGCPRHRHNTSAAPLRAPKQRLPLRQTLERDLQSPAAEEVVAAAAPDGARHGRRQRHVAPERRHDARADAAIDVVRGAVRDGPVVDDDGRRGRAVLDDAAVADD